MARRKRRAPTGGEVVLEQADIEDDIDDINRQLEELQDSLQRLKVRVRNEDD